MLRKIKQKHYKIHLVNGMCGDDLEKRVEFSSSIIEEIEKMTCGMKESNLQIQLHFVEQNV